MMNEETNYREQMDKEDPDIRVEIGVMRSDGGITILDKGALESGQPTLATQDVSQKDPEFIEYCKSFHLNKPGDSYYKQYQWINESWVLVAEGVSPD